MMQTNEPTHLLQNSQNQFVKLMCNLMLIIWIKVARSPQMKCFLSGRALKFKLL